MARSQNGWPASPNRADIGVAGFVVAGVSFPGGVVEGDPATVLGHVAQQFHVRVEALRHPGCWGYNYREIEGGADLSNHSSGTAIDINAPRHPLGASGTFTAAQRAEIGRILAECDGVVRWGGNYSGRKDEMHFELVGTPVQVSRVAAQLRDQGGVVTMLCRKGDTGQHVKALQEMLKHAGHSPGAIDGEYGPGTAAALLACRKAMGSSATSGDVYDGTAYMQVHMAFVKRNAAGTPGPKGDPGPQGPPGPKGDAAVLPAGATLIVQS